MYIWRAAMVYPAYHRIMCRAAIQIRSGVELQDVVGRCRLDGVRLWRRSTCGELFSGDHLADVKAEKYILFDRTLGK